MKYENKEAFEQVNMFGTGTPNTAYAKFFIGDSFLNPLTDPKGSLFAANVTFEPACRNNWHIHHATSGGGQLLLCTAGEGWYQEEGKDAVSLHEGSVTMIPATAEALGMARKGTAGSATSPLKSPAKTAGTSGASRSRTKSTISCNRRQFP